VTTGKRVLSPKNKKQKKDKLLIRIKIGRKEMINLKNKMGRRLNKN